MTGEPPRRHGTCEPWTRHRSLTGPPPRSTAFDRSPQMFNHAPADYDCPLCRLASGGGNTLSTQGAVVLRPDGALASVASGWWPKNRPPVLVVPAAHPE